MSLLQNSIISSSNNPERLALVLDVGTTAIKAFLFDSELNIIDQQRIAAHCMAPLPGWVEQNSLEIYEQVVGLIKDLCRGRKEQVIAIGLTGQRESVVAWDPLTEQPLYPLISWQDARTKSLCRDMNHTPAHRAMVREKTGLFIDSGASAPKLRWLLNSVNMLTARWGTLDTWLLYKLTNEKTYATDRTNASRTLLFNIHTLEWDEALLKLFSIPGDILPEVLPSSADFGTLDVRILDQPILIRAVAGDQQASLYAAGIVPGTCKVTYGTGIFAMKTLQAFELRDGLQTALTISEGMGSLYALEGHIPRAVERVLPVLDKPKHLEAVLTQLAFETSALLRSMLNTKDRVVVADGGLSQADYLLRKQEDFLEGVQIVRQRYAEGTALGIAKLLFAHETIRHTHM